MQGLEIFLILYYNVSSHVFHVLCFLGNLVYWFGYDI